MADPLLDSVTATPPSLTLGQTATIKLVAHDMDASVTHLLFTVSDQAGHTGVLPLDIPIGDPLTYSGFIQSGGGTLLQDTIDPTVFHYTAPI